MKSNLLKAKTEIKRLAAVIKENKPKFKQAQRDGADIWQLASLIGRAQFDVRHLGIAYGLLRGRTRDQIERPKENNMPREEVIEKYLKEYAHEEAVCASAG